MSSKFGLSTRCLATRTILPCPHEEIQGLHAIRRATGFEIDHGDMAFLTSHLPDIPPWMVSVGFLAILPLASPSLYSICDSLMKLAALDIQDC